MGPRRGDIQYLSIAVVEDHPVSRLGLSDLINAHQGWRVCCAPGSVDEVRKHLPTWRPDIVVLDLMLNHTNVLPLIKEIKSTRNPPRVLVLSMLPEEVYGERAMAEGADGYINKEETADEILRAITNVMGGDRYMSSTLRARVERTAQSKGENAVDSMGGLTKRELQVFELLGLGFVPKQVAMELHLSPKTVETHIANIRTKLDLASGAELAHRAVLWRAERILPASD